MPVIRIDTDQLKDMFIKAYEAGWHGSKELANQTAQELCREAVCEHWEMPLQQSNMSHSSFSDILTSMITQAEPIYSTISSNSII